MEKFQVDNIKQAETNEKKESKEFDFEKYGFDSQETVSIELNFNVLKNENCKNLSEIIEEVLSSYKNFKEIPINDLLEKLEKRLTPSLIMTPSI